MYFCTTWYFQQDPYVSTEFIKSNIWDNENVYFCIFRLEILKETMNNSKKLLWILYSFFMALLPTTIILISYIFQAAVSTQELRY